MEALVEQIEFNAATATIEYNITEAGLAELRNKTAGLKASDKESYKAVTQALSEVRTLRTGIEKRRVEYKADALEYGRRIDAEAKRVTALVIQIENPLKEEKDSWDNEQARIKLEKERIDQERIRVIIDRIDKIKNSPIKHQGKNSAELSEVIGGFEVKILNDDFDYLEFKATASVQKQLALTRLKEMRNIAQKQEIEAIHLTEERKQLEKEKAEWESRKAIEIIEIDIKPPPEIVINQEFMDKVHESNAKRASDNLAQAIAQVEFARGQSNTIINTANNFNEESFPLGKPTYNELIWIIEKMAKRITAKTSDEFVFYENVIKMLKLVKGE